MLTCDRQNCGSQIPITKVNIFQRNLKYRRLIFVLPTALSNSILLGDGFGTVLPVAVPLLPVLHEWKHLLLTGNFPCIALLPESHRPFTAISKGLHKVRVHLAQ